MPEDMLQDYEEVVQRDVVRVKLPPELEAWFDHLLDDQLEDVDQVALLYQDRVAIWKNKRLLEHGWSKWTAKDRIAELIPEAKT